jgi:hypothetical protein
MAVRITAAAGCADGRAPRARAGAGSTCLAAGTSSPLAAPASRARSISCRLGVTEGGSRRSRIAATGPAGTVQSADDFTVTTSTPDPDGGFPAPTLFSLPRLLAAGAGFSWLEAA